MICCVRPSDAGVQSHGHSERALNQRNSTKKQWQRVASIKLGTALEVAKISRPSGVQGARQVPPVLFRWFRALARPRRHVLAAAPTR